MKRFFLLALLPLFSLAIAQKQPTYEPRLADRIVAVVNAEVVTYVELHNRLEMALRQLKSQGTPLPPQDVLEAQMLERLITDKLQLQFAKEQGMRVDDAQLEQAIIRIAANNKLDVETFRRSLEKDKVPFAAFREEIRQEMLISRIKEREVFNQIIVSESEIDHFLAGEAAQAQQEYELAHILLRVPESASPETIAKIKTKAEGVLAKARAGENFAQLAAAYSDAPDALQGGLLGRRPLDRLPTIFAKTATELGTGEVSSLIRSPNGFHIVKLLGKTGDRKMPSVEQIHARHILIRVDALNSAQDARHKLEGIRERIAHGEKFEALARLFSQDGSASKGGDLGWLYPGDTVPEFERAMIALKIGEVSAPIQSPFGFHLIEVIERKNQDASGERQRAMVRQAIKERRADEAYQDWLRQLRDQAHVEVRLQDE